MGKYTKEELQNLFKKAKEYIPEKVEYYSNIIGVKVNRITIRAQHTRWGSCSINGNLNFNCLLMLYSNEVIDSVIVHELCHLKYMNHSKDFYNILLKYYPKYKECKKKLRLHEREYLSKLP